ncbi:MAG: OmpA family protein [Betaproteobacteria bacterium]|nr:OmpA family protein [Betaproteobacteria bacterium]
MTDGAAAGAPTMAIGWRPPALLLSVWGLRAAGDGIYVPGYVEQYPVYESTTYITQEYVVPAPPIPAAPIPPPPPPPTPYYRAPAIAQAAPPAPAPAPAPVLQLERYTLSASELFEFDRSELRVPQPKLDEIAAVLVSNPQIGNVNITGYTDRLGTDAYNLKLSQQRADAVKGYLVAGGVAADRLVAVGRGEADPVVQCKQTARAALIKCLEPNRRVEVAQITVERVRPQR